MYQNKQVAKEQAGYGRGISHMSACLDSPEVVFGFVSLGAWLLGGWRGIAICIAVGVVSKFLITAGADGNNIFARLSSETFSRGLGGFVGGSSRNTGILVCPERIVAVIKPHSNING